MCKFRNLRADEIDARVQSFTEKGAILLLYKDARCDMNILDETVGASGWQREHYECKGNLFCRVGIKCDNEWIWKSDCGAESNTEKEKGESSDSFKRACFNWGIGRELYTSPFIFVQIDKINTYKDKNGKTQTRDKFSVSAIDTNDDKQIVGLIIKNDTSNEIVYKFGTLYKQNTGSNSGEKKADKEIQDQKEKEQILTLTEAKKVVVKVVDMTGKTFDMTLEEVYSKCRSKVKDLYANADDYTKRAIELVEAEYQRKKEEKQKELKEKIDDKK
jgi:hypothetical protein